MTLLIGGVGPDGAGIYQVAGDDLIPKNDMGYCAIGSGSQPAESEFIKSDYERSSSVEYVLSTVAAANYQAKKASGVGGDPDFVIVDSSGIDEIDDRVEAKLMRREEEIADIQKSVKSNIRDYRTINRNP